MSLIRSNVTVKCDLLIMLFDFFKVFFPVWLLSISCGLNMTLCCIFVVTPSLICDIFRFFAVICCSPHSGLFPLSAQCLVPSLCSYSCLMDRPCQLLYLHLLQAQVYIFPLQSLWVLHPVCSVSAVFRCVRLFSRMHFSPELVFAITWQTGVGEHER